MVNAHFKILFCHDEINRMQLIAWFEILGIGILQGYASSKAASEKELLRYNCEIEIVSLACGLVGGGTLLSSMPESMGVLISQATRTK